MNDSIQHLKCSAHIKSDLPFSTGVRAGGFFYLSGMASVDERGRVIADTFDNEARRTYDLIGRILVEAGLTFSQVVQVRCYLAKQDYWDAHNRIYREFFAEPFPARTTLIGCLGDLVKYEVDLVAYAGI